MFLMENEYIKNPMLANQDILEIKRSLFLLKLDINPRKQGLKLFI